MSKPTDQQAREIEVTIETATEAVNLRDTLLRLQKNPDFIKVVEESFTREFGHSLIMQRGLPQFRTTPALIEANTRKLDSIAELAGYFRSIIAQGNHYESVIAQGTQMLDDDYDEDDFNGDE